MGSSIGTVSADSGCGGSVHGVVTASVKWWGLLCTPSSSKCAQTETSVTPPHLNQQCGRQQYLMYAMLAQRYLSTVHVADA